MTVTVKNLLEERQQIVVKSRELLNRSESEKRLMNAEEEKQWDAMNDEITNLGKRIERLRKQEEIESAHREIDDHGLGNRGSLINSGRKAPKDDGDPDMNSDQAWNALINGWGRAGKLESTDRRARNASKMLKVSMRGGRITVPLMSDYRNAKRTIIRNAAMSVGTDANGGYTVPDGFVPALESALLAFGPMMQVGDVLRTESGNDLHWPTVDDTGNTGALLAEATSVGSSTIATFSEVVFKAYKFSSKLVQISSELLQDSQFDLATELGTQLGTRLGRVLNTYFTTGTNSSQPQGVVAGSTLGVTAADDASLTYDEIIDLEHSIGLAYRPRMAYMCNDNVVKALRKLKNSNDDPLWQPNWNSGQPELLNGRPLFINNDMADMAANAKAVLAGDFSKFKIRMVASIRNRRLTERYADTDQEGFISFLRADSKVLDAGTHPIKHLVMAAS